MTLGSTRRPVAEPAQSGRRPFRSRESPGADTIDWHEDARKATTTRALCIRLTGEVSIDVGGMPAAGRHLRSQQARAVLAMLVLERTRPVGRAELAALLWGDAPPLSWESVLRTAVARVRAAFQEAGLDGRATVWASSGHYRLSLPERTVVDVESVAATIEHARVALAEHRSAAAVDALEEAVAVTRRPFLPELDGDWVREHRARLWAARLRALEALGEARLAAGLPGAAVAAVREVIDLDPFRESSHRLLMAVLAGSGNRAKALLAYEKCRRLLAEELGADPSPETEAMYRELLGGEGPGRPDVAGLPTWLRIMSEEPLAGRSRELAVFGRLDLTSPGPPRVVLVSGEAGVGKTTLIAHAAEATGALVLYGRCAESRKLAYRPFVEALTQLAGHVPGALLADIVATYGTGVVRLVPELRDGPAPGPEPGDRHLLFRAVATLLTRVAADRAVWLIVDDLHRADELSLLLLRYLAGATEPSRLVFVAAYRDPAGADVARTVAGLPSAVRLRLAGLSVTELTPLVESVAGQRLGPVAAVWARAVWRESGGNPFYAKELLTHLAGRFGPVPGWVLPDQAELSLPDSVCDAVAARVAELGDDVAGVLAHAAVAGQDFDLATLVSAGGADENEVLAALDVAVRAGLLVELPGDTGYFAFRHVIVRRAVYGRLGVTRRRWLHRRVAIALEQSYTAGTGARLDELARHWLLGHGRGERRHAAAWAYQAGTQARASAEALRWFREAFACLGGWAGDDALHIDILIGLGAAQRGVGDQDYRETLLTAARLAESARDTGRLVRAVVANNRGSISCGGRLDTERVALLESAIAATEPTHPRRPLLDAILAAELLATPDATRRARLADDAVRAARDLGDPEVLGRVLALRFEATWAPATRRQRLADSAELLALAATSPDRRQALRAARLRALACWEHGRTAESDEHLAAECRLADVLDDPYLRWGAALSRTGRLLAASRLATAEDAAKEALRLGSAAGEPDAMLAYGAQLFNLRRQQGRSEELLPVLLSTDGFANFDIRPAIALIHADRGAPERARAVAGDLLERQLSPPVSQAQAGGCWLLAELAGALGDVAAAGRLYELLRGWRRLFLVNPVVREGPVERHLGVLAATTGDLTRAVGHLASAMRAADAVPMPYWAAETRVALARTLLRRGAHSDRERARELLERADEAARRFGFAGLRRAVGAVGAGVVG